MWIFFVISESTANEIKKIYSRFLSSEQAKEIMNEKFENWELQEEEEEEREYNRHSNDYDNGSNWDNEYYNDGLDIDQQSPELWDSL